MAHTQLSKPSPEIPMTINLHAAATQTFLTALGGLSQVLKKAEANAAERKIDPSVFLTARLAPDMFHLTRQVQVATDTVKGAVHRLAGLDIPKFEDTETTFSELQARIAKTVALVKSIPADAINGQEARTVTMRRSPTEEMSFSGQDYLLSFALPNFMFHVVMAYGILRHNGVPLGKNEFFGRA
jgi:uncharacterized protein